MEVIGNDKIEDNTELVDVPKQNNSTVDENKAEKRLKIGEHYLVRRSNKTWRRFFLVLVCIIVVHFLY